MEHPPLLNTDRLGVPLASLYRAGFDCAERSAAAEPPAGSSSSSSRAWAEAARLLDEALDCFARALATEPDAAKRAVVSRRLQELRARRTGMPVAAFSPPESSPSAKAAAARGGAAEAETAAAAGGGGTGEGAASTSAVAEEVDNSGSESTESAGSDDDDDTEDEGCGGCGGDNGNDGGDSRPASACGGGRGVHRSSGSASAGLGRAPHGLLERALEEDRVLGAGDAQAARRVADLFADAAAELLAALKGPGAGSEGERRRMRAVVDKALRRAEHLRGLNPPPPPEVRGGGLSGRTVAAPAAAPAPAAAVVGPPPTGGRAGGGPGGALSLGRADVARGDTASVLTAREKEILKRTSLINGRVFLPWINRDLAERFQYPAPFEDPDGLLGLSAKQRQHFAGWRRPGELPLAARFPPRVIAAVNPYAVTQTLVSDCSFVASLSVCAAYERRFRKRLITGKIWPQNAQGLPVFNPSGKYQVKLHANGVWRKVVVDDRFPTDRSGHLLCSHSTQPGELWVSLLEKAYLKVCGGYDFPGSTSEADLYAMTGWIPESVRLHDADCDTARLWARMLRGSRSGDCLLTISTGASTREDLGLIPSHAYAVLDVREACGRRMLQLRNPWSHVRWRGEFCQDDERRWTPEMQRACGYDRRRAADSDDGVFFASFETALRCFGTVHMSWKPDLFPFRRTFHSSWTPRAFLDRHAALGLNPQFEVSVGAGRRQRTSVWVLLLRHTLTKLEAASDDFVTVHVYDRLGSNPDVGARRARRLLYADAPPLYTGTYVNAPHCLMKFDVPPDAAAEHTLVVSSIDTSRRIDFTLRVYATQRFSAAELPLRAPFHERVEGAWTASTAGGCPNFDSYPQNPRFALRFSQPCRATLQLVSVQPIFVGLAVAPAASPAAAAAAPIRSGDYRKHYCAVEVDVDREFLDMVVVPSTFEPGCLGAFELTVDASSGFSLRRISN